MTLLACPDCGRQVSDQAPACPNCGRPLASSMVVGTEKPIELTSKRFKKISLISLGLVFFGFVLMYLGAKAQSDIRQFAAFGPFFIMAGIIIYIVNRVRIWWHHK